VNFEIFGIGRLRTKRLYSEFEVLPLVFLAADSLSLLIISRIRVSIYLGKSPSTEEILLIVKKDF